MDITPRLATQDSSFFFFVSNVTHTGIKIRGRAAKFIPFQLEKTTIVAAVRAYIAVDLIMSW